MKSYALNEYAQLEIIKQLKYFSKHLECLRLLRKRRVY